MPTTASPESTPTSKVVARPAATIRAPVPKALGFVVTTLAVATVGYLAADSQQVPVASPMADVRALTRLDPGLIHPLDVDQRDAERYLKPPSAEDHIALVDLTAESPIRTADVVRIPCRLTSAPQLITMTVPLGAPIDASVERGTPVDLRLPSGASVSAAFLAAVDPPEHTPDEGPIAYALVLLSDSDVATVLQEPSWILLRAAGC